MRAIRHVPVVLLTLGTVACSALLGDFSVGAGASSGGLTEGGVEGGEGGGEAGALSITPMEVKIGVLRAQTFTASMPVTWAVQEAGSGTIDAAGKFVAIDKPGVVHVVATSKTDPTLTATATITVAPLGITILTGVNGGEGNIDGPPLKAHFRQPGGVAHIFDSSGNADRYYIADSGNQTIRLYETATQKVSTIAGTLGVTGRSDGIGTASSFNSPRQIIADRKRNLLYIVDGQGSCIRQLDPSNNAVTTVGGQCGVGSGGDGGGGVLAGFSNIESIDVNIGKFSGQFIPDGAEAIFVCDSGNRIRKLALNGAAKGTTTTIVNTSGCVLATDNFSGGGTVKDVYYLDSTGTGQLRKFSDTPPYTSSLVAAAPESFTSGIGIGSGQGPFGIYVLPGNQSLVYRATEPVSSVVFDAAPFFGVLNDQRVIDGPFATATVGNPNAIDVITERGAGSLLLSDNAAAAIRQADLGTKKLTTFIGAARMIDRVDGPRSAARLTGPFAITSDSTGTIFFADPAFDGAILNNTIRKVDSAGVVSTVAGKPGKPSVTVPPVDGSKDEATFGFPVDLVSVKGNLYVVDAFGQAVRKITATGDVTTFAGELGVAGGTTDAIGGAAHFKFADTGSGGNGFGGGIATDGTDLFVCDGANFAIRKIAVATGQVTLLAGGTTGTANGIGKAAQFVNPFGLAYDNGFLYIADAGDFTIRKLDLKTNEVTGFMGLSGQAGDTDGDAGTAMFRSPARVQSDGIGNLFVAEIPLSNGSFPGVIRRIDIGARKVFPYAGAVGKLGLATGSLPSTVNCPLSFTVTPAGDLAFVDFCDASVAVIKPL